MVQLNDFGGQKMASSRKASPCRFQFSAFDLAMLLALHAVAINGTLELYRSGSTEHDPRSMNRVVWSGGSWPPEVPGAPVVNVVGGRMRVTTFWFRRFAICAIVGSLAILISLFGSAAALKSASQDVRRAAPRLAAALVCLLFVSVLSGLTYAQHNPESYVEIHGRRIHPVVVAAFWAIGPAVLMGIAVCLEMAWHLGHNRVRSL
jgi:cytochrome bd-type quinol oxidase subunit 2